jgi:glycosyltransferase involved in cell wall biosynthesis
MNVLMVNKYLFQNAYPAGGPESYLFRTEALLKQYGHSVVLFGMEKNAQVSAEMCEYLAPWVDYNEPGKSLREQIRTAVNMIYSRSAERKMTRLLDATQMQVAHFHNIYHQLSPSIFRPVRRRNIPIVLTAHDYKMACPNYRLYTHDGICFRCVRGKYYHGVIHRCVKNSTSASLLASVEMYVHHTILDIYRKNIDVVIAPSAFTRDVLIKAGFSPQRVQVLPYFIDASSFRPRYDSDDYIVYLGRLVFEKGIYTLLEAMRGLPTRLVIVGDGPERALLQAQIESFDLHNVRLIGSKSGQELADLIRGAKFVVVPSEWHDNSPIVIYEAFAWGKPVIGARVGGIPSLIEDHVTGLLFEAGQAKELREHINYLAVHSELVAEMGVKARHKVESEYSAKIHYDKLMTIYDLAKRFSD